MGLWGGTYEAGYDWNNIIRIANDRSGCRDLVVVLCAEMQMEDKVSNSEFLRGFIFTKSN